MKETFNILSLSGGGIKGIFQSTFLHFLEDMYKVPLYQLCDLVAGTSTGSIVGAALSCGISMDEYAIVCIDQTEDENGNNQVIHSLRYDEINNLMNWYTRERIRRQDIRLQALEEQNMMLMNEISALKQ